MSQPGSLATFLPTGSETKLLPFSPQQSLVSDLPSLHSVEASDRQCALSPPECGMHLEVSPSGSGPLRPADAMDEGEVVNEGWLIKSPPQKRFPRAVSGATWSGGRAVCVCCDTVWPFDLG